jgi:hypothetical protein
MPRTIDAKLSSIRIILAASLLTSDPVMPIAMPMSAFFSAGESLTPSPVTATISPRRWQPSTMRSFCCGDVRANTICSCASTASSCASLMSRSSSPCTTIALASRSGTSSRSTPRASATSLAVSPRMMPT